MHDFYAEVTPTGVGAYLKGRKEPIVSAADLKQAKLESKIKDVWKVVDVQPNLVREEAPSVNEKFNEESAATIPGQPVSAEVQAELAARKQMKKLSKEQQLELKQKMKDLKLKSRDLPDSSMTTYFGKPAFFLSLIHI